MKRENLIKITDTLLILVFIIYIPTWLAIVAAVVWGIQLIWNMAALYQKIRTKTTNNHEQGS